MGHSGGGVALYALAILTIAALVSSVLLWQRVTNMQEQLARQSADSGTQAVEARTIAQQAQDVAVGAVLSLIYFIKTYS